MANIGAVSTEAAESAIEEALKEYEAFSVEAEQQVRKQAMSLQEKARAFVVQYNHDKQITSQIGDQDLVSLPMKVIKNAQQYKSIMHEVFQLQKSIMIFLGQKIELIFVYTDPRDNYSVTLRKLSDTEKDLSVDRASSKRGGTISGRYSRKFIQDTKFVIDEYDDSSLQATYSEVYRRYLKSKEYIKLKGAAYIFWKINNKDADGVYITGAGVLAEAYVNFYVNMFKGFVNETEQDVCIYMRQPKYGAIVVDATSGFLQGDVSKDGTEYAVKATGASAMGYSEIVDYAREILMRPQGTLKEYLVGLDGKGGLRKQLADEGEKKHLAMRLSSEMKKTIQGLGNWEDIVKNVRVNL